jgi:ATP-dependent Clp protease ATP-binding subunit ClpC
LRRTIQREIEDILSEKILYGEFAAGQIVVVDVETVDDEKRFTFRGEAKPIAPDAPPVEAAETGSGPAAGTGAAETA